MPKKKNVPGSERAMFAFMFTLMENKMTNGRLPEWEIMWKLLNEVIICSKYSIQKEDPSSGQLHWQAFIVTKEKISQRNLRRKIRENKLIKPFFGAGCLHLKPARSQSDSDIYCQKDDTRIEGPYLLPAERYSGQDLPHRSDFYPWQEDCISILEGPVDPRHIHVYVNQGGNCGKSDLVKWCSINLGTISVPLSRSSERAKSAMIDAGYRKAYLFDLTRNTVKDMGEIYDLIEEVKTGHIKSAFYGKFKETLMHRPHIVLFMNRIPRIKFLSQDMWRIHEITDWRHPVREHDVSKLAIQQAKQDLIQEVNNISNKVMN